MSRAGQRKRKRIGFQNGGLIPLGDGTFRNSVGDIVDAQGNVLQRGNTSSLNALQNINAPSLQLEQPSIDIPIPDVANDPRFDLNNIIEQNTGAISSGATALGEAVEGRAGSVLGGFGQGAGIGATVGSVVPGIGTAVGTVAGGLLGAARGLFGGDSAADREREAERMRREQRFNQLSRAATQRGTALAGQLNQFRGNPNTGFFRGGGRMTTPYGQTGIDLLNGGRRQISDGVFLIDGPSHDRGGVSLDINNDNIPDAEIEGGEVLDANRGIVFSDTIKPTKETLEMVNSDLGIKAKGTFSDVVESLNRRKAKFQNPTTERDRVTSERMLARIDQAEQLLFDDQQNQNGDNGLQNAKMGGFLDMGVDKSARLNRGFLDTKSDSTKFRRGGRLRKPLYGQNGLDFSNLNPELVADTLSGINLLGNQRAVRNLETELDPTFIDAQPFTFTDTTSAQERRNAESTRQILNNIRASSTQGQAAAAAALQANRLRADADVNTREQQRRDASLARFRSEEARRGIINSQIANQAAASNLARRNQQRALEQRARTSFIDDILANRQQSILNQRERDRIALTSLQQGDRGTIDRFIEQNPDLARRLGLS